MIRTVILELDTCEDCPYIRHPEDRFGHILRSRCGHSLPEKIIPKNGLNIPRWCPLPTEKKYLEGSRECLGSPIDPCTTDDPCIVCEKARMKGKNECNIG